MADHPKEAKRTLKKIRICDDGCFDVFRLLPPKKVGLEVAAVSDRFDALVDTQFEHYRKWTLGGLDIESDEYGIFRRNEDGTDKVLPFPKKPWAVDWPLPGSMDPFTFMLASMCAFLRGPGLMPLPNSVVGFSRVSLRSFNFDAIAFFNSIGRLLQSNISLGFSISGEENWATFATSVLPQLKFSAIDKIWFKNPSDFHQFRRLTSPAILCDCANLRFVTFFRVQTLQFPPNDSAGSSEGQALCQWLHTPRADGRPKVIKGCAVEGVFPMGELKAYFLSATTSVNFIIVCYSDVHPFELINPLTREQMKCRQIGDYWTIVRCKIDRNEKQWAEWEEEAEKYRFGEDWKTFEIRV